MRRNATLLPQEDKPPNLPFFLAQQPIHLRRFRKLQKTRLETYCNRSSFKKGMIWESKSLILILSYLRISRDEMQRSAQMRCLVREFIDRVLYAPEQGYFNKIERIAAPKAPLDFRAMKGRSEYVSAVSALYAGKWTTPVELFQPVYAQAIGRWILKQSEQFPSSRPLQIVEIGAGSVSSNFRLIS